MDDQREGLALLLTDLRVAMLLLNEGRHRCLTRVFGVSRDQANVATLVLLGIVLAGMHEKVDSVRQPPSREALTNMGLGVAVIRELFSQAAGPLMRDTPFSGDLMMLAALVWASRPVRHAVAGWHPGRRLALSFRHRYGHHLRAVRSRAGVQAIAATPASPALRR